MVKMTKITKNILLVLCCVFITLGSVLLISGINTQQSFAFSGVEIKTQYMIEDVLEIPNGKFTVSDKEYNAETVVYYPNGDVKKTNVLRFVDAGNYVIEYRAEINGKLYSETYETNAVKSLYSLSSGVSSAEYKLDDSQYNTGISGLAVELAKGNAFSFNKVIDLNELNGEDIISLFVLPKTYGKRDFTDIKLYITDAYNSSNQVVVQFNCVNSKGVQGTSKWNVNAGMAFVGFNENLMYGYRTNSSGDSAGTSAYEKHSTSYRYGYESAFSFSGSLKPTDYTEADCVVGKQFFTVRMDVDSGKVFVGSNGNAQIYNYESEMAANLKDRSIYTNAWQGFTTGEVYLSIKCDGYISNSACLMINKIGNEDLSGQTDIGLVDSKINVDLGDYTQDNLPMAKVGSAYKLFEATLKNRYNEEVVVSPRVYFNYNSPLYSEIEVVDGTFTPDRKGFYTVVYQIVDNYGETVRKCFTVIATDDMTLSAQLDGTYSTVGVAGSSINIAALNVQGASGNVDITCIALKDGKEYVIEKDVFVPEVSGTYEIKYTVIDYLGQKVDLSYQITVSVSDIPVVFKAGNMPKYFIEGKLYVLPEFDIRDLSTEGGSDNVNSTITVVDGNGTTTLLADRKYTPKADANGKTLITYSATGANGHALTLPTMEISVVDVKNDYGIDITKYFAVKGNVNVDVDSSGATYSSASDFSFEFIKPLLANTFTLATSVSIIEQYATTSGKYVINLEDSVNSEQNIEIAIEKKLNKLFINVNDVRYVSFVEFHKTSMFSGIVTIEYRQGTLYFNDSEIVVPISTYLNGKEFNGFTSGFVNFTLAGVDIQGANAIKISQINNQPVRKVIRNDAVLPEIALVDNIKRTVEIGDVITLSDVVAGDVLDNNTTVSLTVKNPDGSIARSKDGVLLNNVVPSAYKINVVEYGNYLAEYVAVDGNGGKYTYTVNIASVDLIPPEIIVDDEIEREAEVGDKINIPEATITDNAEGNYRLQIYVCTPLNVYTLYNSKNTYKFTMVGEWKIIYLAYDANENETVKTFTVKVK